MRSAFQNEKITIIKVFLGFLCPNHSCKTTFGGTCGFDFLWNTPGEREGSRAWLPGSQDLPNPKSLPLAQSHFGDPQQRPSARPGSTLFYPIESVLRVLARFQKDAMVLNRTLKRPIAQWSIGFSLGELSISAAMAALTKPKLTVSEAYWPDPEMGNYVTVDAGDNIRSQMLLYQPNICTYAGDMSILSKDYGCSTD